MRYPSGHKEETRKQILDTAAVRFRREGLNGVGIKSLMGDVGLTHGGFYAHFPNRDGLVASAVETGLEGTVGMLAEQVRKAKAGRELETFVNAYLSQQHRDGLEWGCTGAALAGEVAREAPETRERFVDGLKEVVGLLAEQLPDGGSSRQRTDRAFVIFAAMMGTLQLARVNDGPMSNRLLKNGRAAALKLAMQPWEK